jgi:hypothetical protein
MSSGLALNGFAKVLESVVVGGVFETPPVTFRVAETGKDP